MKIKTYRRRKRGIKLVIAYAIRAAIPLLGVLLIVGVGFAVKGTLGGHSEDAQNAANQENQGDPSPPVSVEPTPPASAQPVIPKNFTVVLDAGHGGTDPGCVQDEILEKEITLALTMLVKEKLEDDGFEVILTRDADEAVSLSERVAVTNQSGADCFVSIHCNICVEDTSIHGLECYYYHSEEGEKLAGYIMEAVNGASITNNGVIEGNYMVVRDSTIPAVLIETGYLSNPQECEALTSREYQNILADVIVEGIGMMWSGASDERIPNVSNQGGN